MRAAVPSQGPNCSPSGSVAAPPQAWGYTVPDTYRSLSSYIGDDQTHPAHRDLVEPADAVKVEDRPVTLEIDKATLDVPLLVVASSRNEGEARRQGRRGTLHRRTGSRRRRAARTLLRPARRYRRDAAPTAEPGTVPPLPRVTAGPISQPVSAPPRRRSSRRRCGPVDDGFKAAHASLVGAQFARELGVDPRARPARAEGRILQEDVQNLRQDGHARRGPAAGAARRWRRRCRTRRPGRWVDSSRNGGLSKRGRSSAHQEDLARTGVQLGDEPGCHAVRRVEHHRRTLSGAHADKENEKSGVKATMLVFLIKASVAARRSSGRERFARRRQPEVRAVLPHLDSPLIRRTVSSVPVIRNASNQKAAPAIAVAGCAAGEGVRGQAGNG